MASTTPDAKYVVELTVDPAFLSAGGQIQFRADASSLFLPVALTPTANTAILFYDNTFVLQSLDAADQLVSRFPPSSGAFDVINEIAVASVSATGLITVADVAGEQFLVTVASGAPGVSVVRVSIDGFPSVNVLPGQGLSAFFQMSLSVQINTQTPIVYGPSDVPAGGILKINVPNSSGPVVTTATDPDVAALKTVQVEYDEAEALAKEAADLQGQELALEYDIQVAEALGDQKQVAALEKKLGLLRRQQDEVVQDAIDQLRKARRDDNAIDFHHGGGKKPHPHPHKPCDDKPHHHHHPKPCDDKPHHHHHPKPCYLNPWEQAVLRTYGAGGY